MNRRFLIKSGLLASLIPFIPGRKLTAQENCDYTTKDIEGPFYTPNAPNTNKLSPQQAQGTPLFITGTVYASDCETPFPNSLLDVWQADDAGDYDNSGYNYRGKFYTDELGNYSFESVLPGKYLNGDYYRPRHIHFKISGGDSDVLTTQLYFEGDNSIPIDQWASDPDAEGRIIPLSEDNQGNLHGVFDVYLNGNVTDVTDTLAKNTNRSNRIISIAPIPVKEKAMVSFYLAEPTQIVELALFNVVGKQVHSHMVKTAYSGQNALELNFSNNYGLKLPSGIYILQLKTNRNTMDAKRLIIQ